MFHIPWNVFRGKSRLELQLIQYYVGAIRISIVREGTEQTVLLLQPVELLLLETVLAIT